MQTGDFPPDQLHQTSCELFVFLACWKVDFQLDSHNKMKELVLQEEGETFLTLRYDPLILFQQLKVQILYWNQRPTSDYSWAYSRVNEVKDVSRDS